MFQHTTYMCAMCRDLGDTISKELCILCEMTILRILPGRLHPNNFILARQWKFEINARMLGMELEDHYTFAELREGRFYMGKDTWKELDYLPCFGDGGICREEPWLESIQEMIPMIVAQWRPVETEVDPVKLQHIQTVDQLRARVPMAIPVVCDQIFAPLPCDVSCATGNVTHDRLGGLDYLRHWNDMVLWNDVTLCLLRNRLHGMGIPMMGNIPGDFDGDFIIGQDFDGDLISGDRDLISGDRDPISEDKDPIGGDYDGVGERWLVTQDDVGGDKDNVLMKSAMEYGRQAEEKIREYYDKDPLERASMANRKIRELLCPLCYEPRGGKYTRCTPCWQMICDLVPWSTPYHKAIQHQWWFEMCKTKPSHIARSTHRGFPISSHDWMALPYLPTFGNDGICERTNWIERVWNKRLQIQNQFGHDDEFKYSWTRLTPCASLTGTTDTCRHCKQDCTTRCGQCHSAFYCNRECQTLDWALHRHDCRALR